MNSFSISELEAFSGIKAHTIRIWEQRYKAMKPHRTDGNTRYYDDEHLRRLLNIVSLMDADYKISELCSMSDPEINKLLEVRMHETLESDNQYEFFISQIISAGIAFDEPHFEKLFSSCILRFGLKETYIHVIYPLLNRAGLLWAKNSFPTASEHFLTNLIRQKLLSAIDALPPENSAKKSWLLFLPENEFHEIGLLFANYMIRNSGSKSVYLGANVPFASLKSTVDQIHPSNIFFFLVHYNLPETSIKFLEQLKQNFPKTNIHISGNQKLIEQLHQVKGINWIYSVEQLEKEIK